MGPPPIVNGISPREGPPGTKITIRGENLGASPQDLAGVFINGADCLLIAEWKGEKKIVALAPAKEGKGDIIIATKSGGVGSSSVQFRIFKENVGPLKESAVWVNEKYHPRRRKGVLAPTGDGAEDPLGLDVEGGGASFPEDQLQEMFPEATGDISSERFDPSYFLLEHHHATTFDDLKAGLEHLRRKVEGHSQNQLSFIKSNTNSIMDQLDTLKSIKRCYEMDNRNYGSDPTVSVEKAISQCKEEADKMFFDVLGRKDKADKTRNALTVLNRFKFLFNLPANIRGNLAKEDYDRVIEEYERAKSLYGNTEEPLFHTFLQEAEKGVASLKDTVIKKLREGTLSVEQQKKLIGSLVQLEVEGDPAWECVQTRYRVISELMESCKNSHLSLDCAPSPPKPAPRAAVGASPAEKIRAMFTPPPDPDKVPQNVLFVEDLTDRVAAEFPELWKLGQAYFKGELHVEPEPGKQPVFREMVLSSISFFCNLVRAAALPSSPITNREDYGVWHVDATANQWLPHCLRQVRASYNVFIGLDLPGQPLDIVKNLTTDLRESCLHNILTSVIQHVHLLHEKEDWVQDISDQYGSITLLPQVFESLVSEAILLMKEAVLSMDNREDDILDHPTSKSNTELLLQKTMSAFAFALENAATENYYSNQTDIPTDSRRLLLCLNNCKYTQIKIIPSIVGQLSDIEQLSLDKAVMESLNMYSMLDHKLFDAYMELKCEPIIAMIEPNMYTGKFDWARCVRPTSTRDYVKEILHSSVCVHAEVSRLGEEFVSRVMQRLVEAICEEVNRLYCSISRMNSNGCIQAWVDIRCISVCLKPYMTVDSENYVKEARKPLLELDKEKDVELVEQCVEAFSTSMRRHIQCFENN